MGCRLLEQHCIPITTIHLIMGSAIFQDKADVAIFFILSVMLFTELYTGYIQYDYGRYFPNWFNTMSRKIVFMPPNWFFPIVWAVSYFCVFIGMYIFYRSLTLPDFGAIVDTISVLLVINIMAQKTWPYFFFTRRHVVVALFFMLFVLASDVVIISLLGVKGQWITCILWIPYVLWALFALCINSAWLYYENHLFSVG